MTAPAARAEATARPWKIADFNNGEAISGANGETVSYGGHFRFPAVGRANAELIVTAVNAFDDLKNALSELSDAVFGTDVGDEPDVYADYDRLVELMRKSRAALAKAGIR